MGGLINFSDVINYVKTEIKDMYEPVPLKKFCHGFQNEFNRYKVPKLTKEEMRNASNNLLAGIKLYEILLCLKFQNIIINIFHDYNSQS